jgi:D-alanyl-D-alanine carboxypeptidase/D-alanyl-D-alanine-endopeptidase (penicillin-binding protein 4)
MAAEPPATPPPATSVAAPASPLSARVDALLQKLAPPKGKVGVHLLDTASGAPLVARLDDEPLIPASNLKLVTTAAAALRLGPRFEWVTPLATLGTRRPDGVLEGDLLVVGDGDPDFSGRFHDGNPAAVFETWADDLARAGIREVTGGILLDDTAFDRERYPACWESRYYEDWFAAQVAALALNDNCADLTLRPGPAVGEPIGILASPSTAWIRVVNAARTVPGKGDDKIKIERPAGGNDIRVSGQLGVQCNPGTHYVTVHDPVMYFGTALKETLVRRGIAVQGDVRIVPADHDPSARPAEFLTEHRSPLPRALQVVNRRSQNLYAELLLRTLGRQARGQGTRASGVAAVAEALAPLNLPDPVTMEDGCGLARGNRVTARTMAALLARMLLQPEEVRSMYIESLAVPGGEGSLARRFVEESCRSRVKAKTGYINGVSTLSGYLETRQGKVVAFSVLVNGATDVSKAQLLQDSIVKAAIELE